MSNRNGLWLLNPQLPALNSFTAANYVGGPNCVTQSSVDCSWAANVYCNPKNSHYRTVRLAVACDRQTGGLGGTYTSYFTDFFTTTGHLSVPMGGFDDGVDNFATTAMVAQIQAWNWSVSAYVGVGQVYTVGLGKHFFVAC